MSGFMKDRLEDCRQPQLKGTSKRQKSPITESRLLVAIKSIFFEIESKYLNENDLLMLNVIRNKDNSNKENDKPTQISETLEGLQDLANLTKYLAKTKKILEDENDRKGENDISMYEIHLQRLEAQIREHIRVEQQLKLYAESVQAKLEEYEKLENHRRIESSSADLVNSNNESAARIASMEEEIETLFDANKRLLSKNKKLEFELKKYKSRLIILEKADVAHKKLFNPGRLKTDLKKEVRRVAQMESKEDTLHKDRERSKDNRSTLKSILKKTSPPLPTEFREKISQRMAKRTSKDRSSIIEKRQQKLKAKNSESSIPRKQSSRLGDSRSYIKNSVDNSKSYSIISNRSNSNDAKKPRNRSIGEYISSASKQVGSNSRMLKISEKLKSLRGNVSQMQQ